METYEDEEIIDEKWSSWFDNYDWSVFVDLGDLSKIGGRGDCFLFWASECGIDVPDRTELLDSCPIKIHSDMTVKELINAVNNYFRSLLKSGVKNC
ncbi:MAG: hypothetical protein IK062_04060 [Selenomonadaceae bacterium]|nr:hypothetical protein [Selenomonadaceae bacterium]